MYKNDGTTLYHNLKPERDYVAIFGGVRTGLSLGYPSSGGRTYSDFIATWDRSGQSQDGDLNFDIQVDPASLNAPGFWTDGWQYPDGPSIVKSKLKVNQQQLHCEIIT